MGARARDGLSRVAPGRREAPPASDLERLRACAREIKALREDSAGWFARVLVDRLRAAEARRTAPTEATRSDPAAEAKRLIERVARSSAAGGSLSSAVAHLGELGSVLTGEGALVGVPVVFAAVAAETLHAAVAQVDLACDLAALYGVRFDVDDSGELAALFDVALRPESSSRDAARSRLAAWLAPPDRALLQRLARHLVEDALLGLVPLAGVPGSALSCYVTTKRIGRGVHEYVRKRRAVRETLSQILDEPGLDKTLLLEGAWLLASCDDAITHRELFVLAALMRSIPADQRPSTAWLRFVGEGIWVVRMTFAEDERRLRILAALETVAALFGPTTDVERGFFQRVGEALGQPPDVRRIEWLRARLSAG
jgi:hypothetical protein